MAVNFSLNHPSSAISSIDAVVHFKSKRFKRSVGESLPTKYWNTESNNAREVKEFMRGKSINIKLRKIKRACEIVMDKYIAAIQLPDNADFWHLVDSELNNIGAETSQIYFTPYVKELINDIKSRLKKNTWQNYIGAYKWLTKYETAKNTKLQFKDINIHFYNDFEKYINTNGLSLNTFGSFIKVIKVVYARARDIDKLHNFIDASHRNFITKTETADTVYLSDDELLKIYHCDLSAENVISKLELTDLREQNITAKLKALTICRNKFLIGCYTALRVSDFNRLSHINVQDNYITIETAKTGAKVVIPIHWMVREILESGFLLDTYICEQRLNKSIKLLCKIAGIDEDVEIHKTIGGKRVSIVKPKYSFITNHTARRSGATNMFKAGIPSISIMKITGHTTEKAFLKYIKISAEENAQLLASHKFFTNK